ncbi:MAG TPA: phage integrase SAM-like domain-containing protein, partial [Gemmataceae bacterium]|nr:phage integrase SAM-like domain-containing protein [Gemmataceae bacterium]
VAGVGDVLAEKMAALGLITRRVKARPLGDYLDHYIAGRTDYKESTTKTIDQTRRLLVAHFGANLSLDKIKPADAENWRNDLRTKGYKPATIATHVKRAKQMFQHAVDSELLDRSPFAKLKPGQQVDKTREEFITHETVKSVIDAAPDGEWRLIIALARFGGLRCPSEVTALEWRWIDWARDRFTVFSPKLEHFPGAGMRVVPIFPELRPYLEEAFELAKPGAVHVVTRYRDGCKNLRTQFQRIIRKAGATPWQRLFHNLRSSRQTELTETFPAHVVASWLGNSVRIATQHYLQTTEEHFRRGAQSGALAAQNPAQQGAAPACKDSNESTEVATCSGVCETLRDDANLCVIGEYPRQESNL